jgi:hypothetical protein
MPIIPELKRLKQGELKFKTKLSYRVRPCLKTKQKTKAQQKQKPCIFLKRGS